MLESIDYLEKKVRIMTNSIDYIEQSTVLIDWNRRLWLYTCFTEEFIT